LAELPFNRSSYDSTNPIVGPSWYLIQSFQISPPPGEWVLSPKHYFSLSVDSGNISGRFRRSGKINAAYVTPSSLSIIIGELMESHKRPAVSKPSRIIDGGKTFMITFPVSSKKLPFIQVYSSNVRVLLTTIDSGKIHTSTDVADYLMPSPPAAFSRLINETTLSLKIYTDINTATHWLDSTSSGLITNASGLAESQFTSGISSCYTGNVALSRNGSISVKVRNSGKGSGSYISVNAGLSSSSSSQYTDGEAQFLYGGKSYDCDGGEIILRTGNSFSVQGAALLFLSGSDTCARSGDIFFEALHGCNGASSGGVFIKTRNSSTAGFFNGNFTLDTGFRVSFGSSDFSIGSEIVIKAGDTLSKDAMGGSINIQAGSGKGIGGIGGAVRISGGFGAGSTYSDDGGDIFITGGNSTTGSGGSLYLASGFSGTGSSGSVHMVSANSGSHGVSGPLFLKSGASKGGTSGSLFLGTGGTDNGAGGDITVAVGDGSDFNGGSIYLRAGKTQDSVGGDIRLYGGEGSNDHSQDGGDGGNLFFIAGEAKGEKAYLY
jgi:hypothetical protein